jgi:hypothetical protein
MMSYSYDRRLARAIRLDKRRIKELSKELEKVLVQKLRSSRGPLGRRMLVPSAPYDIRTVDGQSLTVFIRMQTVETKSPYYVVSGGLGYDRSGKVAVVININGSIPSEDIYRAAKGRSVALQIYPVLIHELTHAADKFTRGVGERMTEEEARDNAAYYNDPGEVRAYMQEVVDESEEHFKSYNKLESAFGPGKALQYLLNTGKIWKEISPYWTERNKRLVIKAVVHALNDWKKSLSK